MADPTLLLARIHSLLGAATVGVAPPLAHSPSSPNRRRRGPTWGRRDRHYVRHEGAPGDDSVSSQQESDDADDADEGTEEAEETERQPRVRGQKAQIWEITEYLDIDLGSWGLAPLVSSKGMLRRYVGEQCCFFNVNHRTAMIGQVVGVASKALRISAWVARNLEELWVPAHKVFCPPPDFDTLKKQVDELVAERKAEDASLY